MMKVVFASMLFLPLVVWGQIPSHSAPTLNAGELFPVIDLGCCVLDISSEPGSDMVMAYTPFASTLSRAFVLDRTLSSSSHDVLPTEGVHFVAPTLVMEPNNNKWHTFDRQFMLFSVVSTLAALADIETTARAMEINPNASELNPLFGTHPTRGRLYGIGMPVNIALISWSYYYKKLAPRRNAWKMILKIPIITHSAAAVNNLVVVR